MKRGYIKIQDLYRIKFLREIVLSPCGNKIAYTVEWMDKKKNKYRPSRQVGRTLTEKIKKIM